MTSPESGTNPVDSPGQNSVDLLHLNNLTAQVMLLREALEEAQRDLEMQNRHAAHSTIRAALAATPESAGAELAELRSDMARLRKIVVRLIAWYERPTDNQSHDLIALIRDANAALTATPAAMQQEAKS